MKALNGFTAPDRCYYYLLDWKDTTDGRQYLLDTYNKESIGSLTRTEFWDLFDHVTTLDKR